RPQKVLRSAPDLRRRGCALRNTTIHLKCAREKYVQKQTTPEACKAGSAMARKFIFASDSSHPLPSRFSKKPSRSPGGKASLQPADVMIRVFFLEQCQSWKRWQRWCFAIMRFGIRRLLADRSDACISADGWVAALADSLHFFCSSARFIRGRTWLATGIASPIGATRRAYRCLRGRVFRRQDTSSDRPTGFEDA